MLAVALIVPLLAFTILQIHRPQVEAAARQNLANIAKLKAEKVSLWLAERMRNVQVFELNEGFNRRVESLSLTGNAHEAHLIHARLAALEKNYHYEGAVVLDTQGEALLRRGTVDDDLLFLARQTLQHQTPDFSALRNDRAGRAYIDISSPLFVTENGGQRLVGGIALRQYVDASRAHLTLEWPSLSGTGENLLLIRDPDRADLQGLILNRGEAVMVPLPDELHAVFDQAGSDLAFDHRDRDGKVALASAEAVENTDWVLLTIQNRYQILYPLYQLIFWVSLVTAAAVLVSSSVALLLFRQQRNTLQLKRELEKRETDQVIERFFNLPFTGMAIASLSNRWLKFNDRFCTMLGYTRDELTVTPPSSVTAPGERSAYLERYNRLVRGEIDRYNGEIRLVRKDGAEVIAQIEVSRHQPPLAAEPLLYAMVQDITEERMLQESLERSLRFVRGVADRVPGMIYQYQVNPDGSSSFPYASKAIEHIYQLSREQVAEDANPLLLRIHPEDREAVMASVERCAHDLHVWQREYRIHLRDGTVRWLHDSAQPEREADGAVLWHGFVQDVTEQRRIESDQRIAAAAFDRHHTAMFVTEADGQIIRINEAFTRITGYDDRDVEGHTPALLKSGRQTPEFYEAFWHALIHEHYWEGEIWNKRKNGEIYPEWLSISTVLDHNGEIVNFVGSFTDISNSKEAQRQIQWLSNFDGLTGLPNAALLKDRTEQAILNAAEGDEALAMIRIDLDQFKTINDSLSHRIGDQVLIHMARRLGEVIGPSDTLSRQSGDEFTLLMTFRHQQAVTALLTRMHEVISAPVTIEGQELIVTASAGIALYPADGQDFDGLNKAAEVAMFRAKQDGRNRYAFYEAAMQEEALRALQLSTALHRAEEEDQFQLRYQPQLDLATGRLCGAEALLRWHHPEFGWVSPAEFIPLAEGNGLIISIGEWTLRTAMRDIQAWLAAGLDEPSVAVNLSPLQFRQADLVERVASLLDLGQVPSHHLELELTETAAMDNPERAVKVMQALNDMGVSVAIDDFGTGYSSMNYLKSFAVDKLKIDRSFIDGIDTNEENQAIVLAVIRMAQALDIKVLAEGVERFEEQEFLAANGCAMMQGYLYGKPMPADEFLAFAQQAGAI